MKEGLLAILAFLLILAAVPVLSAQQAQGISIYRYLVVGVKPAGSIDASILPLALNTSVNGVPVAAEIRVEAGEYPLVLRIVAGPLKIKDAIPYSVESSRDDASLDLGGLRLTDILEALAVTLKDRGLAGGVEGYRVLSDYYILARGSATITITRISGEKGMGYGVTLLTTSSMPPHISTATPASPTTGVFVTIPTATLTTSTVSGAETESGAQTPASPPHSQEERLVHRAPSPSTTTSLSPAEKLVSVIVSAGIGLILAVLAYLLVRQVF